MWGFFFFDIKDLGVIFFEINMCCKVKLNYYIKVVCFDNICGIEFCVFFFIV